MQCTNVRSFIKQLLFDLTRLNLNVIVLPGGFTVGANLERSSTALLSSYVNAMSNNDSTFTNLAGLWHQVPRVNLSFAAVNATFLPDDHSYRQVE